MTAGRIELRGVEVHNLKGVDVDIPHRRITVICGVSGSGKTSLALDTLYAEGQRRYIESFSTYTRQFLDPLEKPAADRIDGLPPAIAVTRGDATRSARVTVGTATEIVDYLRLLFAKLGEVHCADCGILVRPESPATAARTLSELKPGTRVMIGFSIPLTSGESAAAWQAQLLEEGFVRVVVGGRMRHLSNESLADQGATNGRSEAVEIAESAESSSREILVIVDRLTADGTSSSRLLDSLETAFSRGGGVCVVLAEGAASEVEVSPALDVPPAQSATSVDGATTQLVDGGKWRRWTFHSARTCPRCRREYADPEPRLLNFNSPLGACAQCEGFGNIVDIDMDRVVPDPGKSIREGAIACWNTPAYTHERDELMALAGDYGIPVDVPYRDLSAAQLALIRDGVPERKFGGLRGFFDWLDKRKYKMHHRVFLSRWRAARPCPACGGQRLRPEALAVRIGQRNLAQLTEMQVGQLRAFLDGLSWSPEQRAVATHMLQQIESRLRYLDAVGLGYLTLDRTLRTLSGGEAQRVALTTTLGASLVNMLYVLDEPSVGMHPADVDRLMGSIRDLRDRGNTVVVVEHEEAMLRAADRILEIGPGAGDNGGELVFVGTLDEMLASPDSLTGDYLSGRRLIASPAKRRSPGHGWLRLTNARGNNLKHVTVEFPLGVLCVVTGVSGAGKSSLVQDTLYGAACHRKRKDVDETLPYDDLFGDGQFDDVVLIDQSPIGRSPRSNPVTYIKAFDLIRAVFAETVEARTHNYTAGHFSFNVEGGRCETCQGDGHLEIDMQFLPDVFMKCGDCGGARYRREILDVAYRGRNIAEVLGMTVREAFGFFRGQSKLQARLKQLIDVGLDYLQLGQPANTLSAGEAQRLKLAAFLSSAGRRRTLFLLDEPTTGLHFSDVVQLLDCFDALLAVGHSLVVVEHNVQVMQAADYIIDLGPGAAEAGGHVVAQGTPEKVARCAESVTGRILAARLPDA